MKWWIYQRERFPLLAHGPLILAFSSCAVSYVALLMDRGIPSWTSYAVAFVGCLVFFLQLRIADEFKDREEDARWRPYRPVPRGLIRLAELRVAFIIGAVLQAGLAYALSPALLWVLLLGWVYLALMSAEFFCRDWLKARPVIYLLTHMGIMPLVDLFATACVWSMGYSTMPEGLSWFLTASFCNGIVIEIGRKLRQPDQEEEGVETYSALWGKRRAVVTWLMAMAVTLFCAWNAGRAIGFDLPILFSLGLLMVGSMILAKNYTHTSMKGSHLEKMSALWTLALYLTLGIIPLLNR
jgi:4-hydroxybenzoate polyprenyltransferase